MFRSSEYIMRHERRIAKTLSFIGSDRYENILDLGCYPGEFGQLLKSKYTQSAISLADVIEPGVPIIDARVQFVKIEDLNTNRLPFTDNSFDLVTNLEMIEHLYNPDNLLAEIHRTLRPEGTLVLSTPNLASWMNRVLLLSGHFPRGLSISIKANLTGASDFILRSSRESQEDAAFDYHVRLYTFGALKALLNAHGFLVTECKGIYGLETPLSNLLIKTLHIVCERFFPSCAQYILIKAVAKKQ